MRVLLSNPPWFTEDETGPRWGIRAGSRWPFTVPPGTPYYPFPFLLAYATSYLRQHEIDAYLVDSILLRESLESYFRRLQDIQFDWVIIETSTPSIEYDLALAEQTAQYAKVALAGPHASVFAEELIEKPFVSAVLKGDYEQSALELVTTGEERIYDYHPVADLDTLPYPYRDHTLYRYYDRFPNNPPGAQLQMWGSRGCPFRCIFCLWPPTMYRNKYRRHQPEPILREIEFTFKQFPRLTNVYFDDDTFNLGDDRVQAICQGLKEMGIPWAAMCRADTSNLETLEMMADSGCFAVKFGMESGSQELVDRCHKRLDLEKVKESVAYLKKRGVWVHATFTWGLPGETRETIRETQKFFRELSPDSTQESYNTPFPGTPYYDMLVASEKLNLTDWKLFDGARHSLIGSAELSSADLLRYARLRPDLFVVGRHRPQHMGPWLVQAGAELSYCAQAVDLWADPSVVHRLMQSRDDDVLVADRGDVLLPDVLDRIPARKILYYPDILPTREATHEHAEKRYQRFSEIAPHFDRVVLHDTHALEFLRERGHDNVIGHVVLPFCPDLHRKLDVEKCYDVVFIGHLSPYRQEWLEWIGRRFSVTVPQVWGEEMVRVINQARIVLNFHFTPLPNTEHRLTESLACGCFVLSEPPTDPDLFTDGVHLVYFSRKDVGDKIAYYLAHEDEREAIARQGMEYVRARYSARQQLQRILEIGNQEIRKLGNLDNRETGKLGNWETGPNFLIS